MSGRFWVPADNLMTVVMEDPQADRTACPACPVGTDSTLVVLDQRIGDVGKRPLQAAIER